jgi:hypothetical protein
MACVRTVTYSMLISGTPSERIVPSKGIQQGDPLSSYLFIICAKALNYLFYHAENTGELTGVPRSK